MLDHLALLCVLLPVQVPFFQGVGDFSGGTTLSSANGVSASGEVVVGYGNAATGEQAFRWTKSTGIVAIGDLPGGAISSQALGVSADGTTIVGDSASASGNEAFRWTAAANMAGLGDLPGGGFFSHAVGVNADGSVVAGHSASTASGTLGAEAFRWTAGTGMQGLGDLPGSNFFSVATAVSADGSRISGYGTSPASGSASSEASRWTAGTGMVGIGDLPGGGFGSNAFGISADGTVIVGLSAASGGVFAFRWTDPAAGGSGMVSLGDLPGGSAFSRANAVSADGKVVVGQSIGPNGMEAFLWIEGVGMRSVADVLVNDLGLNLTGWKLEVATAVSADGRTIVGYGPNPSGNYEGWIAHLGGSTWSDLGNGLAGATGVPLLTGSGPLAAGTNVTVQLSGAKPSSVALLFVGLSEVDLPLAGGILVPSPDVVIANLPTSPAGTMVLATTWPAGVPSQTGIYLQTWIADPAAPQGFSASNGLVGVAP